MSGTVTIIVAKQGFGRAGRLKVKVDGALVGRVRQGTSMEFAVEAGERRFRVSGGGFRSKDVVLGVVENGRHELYAGAHGFVPLASVIAAVLAYEFGALIAAPLFLLVGAVPGTWFFLRTSALSPAADAVERAEQAAAEAVDGEMWWLSDPNLAKRYRNS